MGLFGNTTDATIQEDVERATSDKLVEEDWQQIMNICDKAGKSSEDSKAWLRAIIKRLYNSDPHIGLKAVTLLDACVKNSGKSFHIEVASREFETDFNKLMTKAHPEVAKKLRESLKRWSENEFKSDGQLSLIPSLYHKLRGTYDFSSSETAVKKSTPKSTDPNVVESREEEDEILNAIELSLKETSASPRSTTTASSLYPVHTGSTPDKIRACSPTRTCTSHSKNLTQPKQRSVGNSHLLKVQKEFDSDKEVDDYDIIGKNLANKLRRLPKDVGIIAEKLMNDILFEAHLGNINHNTRLRLQNVPSRAVPLHPPPAQYTPRIFFSPEQ